MVVKILSKLRRKPKPIGYIIVHPARQEFLGYDVVVRKDKYDEFKKLVEDEDLYTTDCKYWKVFLKKNNGYKYLGSEDFVHTFWGNIGSLGTLTWLIEKGFKLVAMDEEYLEKGEWVE